MSLNNSVGRYDTLAMLYYAELHTVLFGTLRMHAKGN
jgi:hypothetical protein